MAYYYIFSILGIWMAIFHPFYISLTDIRFNSAEKRIEMAQRVFWDDLEVALSEKNKAKIDFLNPENPQKLEKIIEAYVLEMNEIHINEQKINLVYLGHEIEGDTAWLYLEGKSSSIPQRVKIRNSLLIQQFDSQQNIVNFYYGETLKSLITLKNVEWGEMQLN